MEYERQVLQQIAEDNVRQQLAQANRVTPTQMRRLAMLATKEWKQHDFQIQEAKAEKAAQRKKKRQKRREREARRRKGGESWQGEQDQKQQGQDEE